MIERLKIFVPFMSISEMIQTRPAQHSHNIACSSTDSVDCRGSYQLQQREPSIKKMRENVAALD